MGEGQESSTDVVSSQMSPQSQDKRYRGRGMPDKGCELGTRRQIAQQVVTGLLG